MESDYDPNRKGYFSRGVYIKQIINCLEYFDRKNMHIIILEDLLKEQKAEWQHLYKFLNIDSLRGLQNLPKPSNESMIYKNPFYSFFFNHPELQRLLPRRGKSILFFGKKEMYKYKLPNSELMVRLNKFYEPHNKAQESFIGKPINHWL